MVPGVGAAPGCRPLYLAVAVPAAAGKSALVRVRMVCAVVCVAVGQGLVCLAPEGNRRVQGIGRKMPSCPFRPAISAGCVKIHVDCRVFSCQAVSPAAYDRGEVLPDVKALVGDLVADERVMHVLRPTRDQV